MGSTRDNAAHFLARTDGSVALTVAVRCRQNDYAKGETGMLVIFGY